MPFTENNRTPRSETAGIVPDQRLSEILHDLTDSYRDLIDSNCEISERERSLCLAKLDEIAYRYRRSRFFSKVIQDLIESVGQHDKLQTFQLFCYLGGIVDALRMHSGTVSENEG